MCTLPCGLVTPSAVLGTPLRPSEFTAVSMGVTWGGGVCTLTEHEFTSGPAGTGSLHETACDSDLHSLQLFPGVR